MQSKYESKEKLLSALKVIIKGQSISTQIELAYELSSRGYKNISQTRISRILKKLGATRVRDTHNNFIYVLPDESVLPKNKQTINTMVLSVDNNGMLVVVKTILGGAIVISRVLEMKGKSFGILGCIADDHTVLVVPTNHQQIEELTQAIHNYLEV
ncbi:transcriptional regulator ArgR [Pseudocolwellia agarivorans]|uniref:transcriptional regulator ArgR n=1 Tax=Pseudocolwellia agarivorans TaxID=1911682 RepID=UPI003F8853A0